MILSHLSEADLQRAIGEDVLARLELLGPVLLGPNADPTTLYKRKNLLRVVNAFGAAGRMKDPTFMRVLLNSLPEPKLHAISQATGVGLGAGSFDKQLDALVAKGWSDHDFCRAFITAAGLPETFLPSFSHPLPPFEEVTPSPAPFKRLKDYQLGVYTSATSSLKPPRARFVVQMPTGSGKTRTAMEVICDQLNYAGASRSVVWLAHAEELCEQAIQCFKEVWGHIGEFPCQVIRIFGTNSLPPLPTNGRHFVVAGFQKLHNIVTRHPSEIEQLARRTDLLVIDEAHKVLAPTFERAAKALIGPCTQVVGLTATPGRTSTNMTENERLAHFFFGEMVGIHPPAGETPISYLRRIEVLSRAQMETLRTSTTFALSKSDVSRLERDLDFPAGFLGKLAADDIRNVEIIRRLKALCEAGRRVLFFSCSVEHSRFVCAVLSYLGFRAAHVDGSTHTQERAEMIRGFKTGQIQVLCNYGILSTGFDAPQTDVVFISRPTQSIVLYSQMVGRGLRGPAIGGTAECLIVNVVDNIVGLPDNDSIYEYFESYWNATA